MGYAVTWGSVVRNTGHLPLTAVTVTDDDLGTVCVFDGPLAPGAQHTCTTTGVAEAGLHGMTGRMSAAPEGGSGGVSVRDPSWYRAMTVTTTAGSSVFGISVVSDPADNNAPVTLARTGAETIGLRVTGGVQLAAGPGIVTALSVASAPTERNRRSRVG